MRNKFDQIMLQQAQKSIQRPVYCRFCGKDLKEPTKESRFNSTGGNTGNYANGWEIQNHTHTTCYQKHLGRRMR